jgi:tRNA A-37 threonylcarbamoyl transferase component Bud32
MPVESHTVGTRIASAAIIEDLKPSHGRFVVHPRYRTWLAKCGLTTPEAVLALRGEIVSGHHDRNVSRVELTAGTSRRIVYLKREHRVGWRVRWRNWRDGFGFVSRSEREARVLGHLDDLALPAPQWIAHGADSRGRVFLLVDDIAGSLDLRIAAKVQRDPLLRREACERIGTAIAELHSAGVTTPDLAAKHVFVRRDAGAATLIDWPSARLGEALSLGARINAFAQLDASLTDSLASSRERMRVLRTYLRRHHGLPPLKRLARQIAHRSFAFRHRSSIRDQRCVPTPNQRLVWLAENEEVCAIPALAKVWPVPGVCPPYYVPRFKVVRSGESTIVLAPDDWPATLVRWRTWTLRGRSWRSPAAQLARSLFASEREGRAAPKLLAFGQRFTSVFTAESFVLFRRGDEAEC